MFKKFYIIIFSALFHGASCQVNLAQHFQQCQMGTPEFDNCIKEGLNDLRPYFHTGLPDYGIHSLDPFFAPEVPQRRSNPFFNYKLVLRNVTESGWSISQITRLKTDLERNMIQYTQSFPDKKLSGWYEIDGTFFGNKVKNSGAWNLSLYDYVQTTTITRRKTRDSRGVEVDNPPLKVKINLQSCKNLNLHIGHLAGGRTIVESMLDWIINTAWQPGLIVLSPLINDLVSTAFTEIFNKDFRYFPFDQVFNNAVKK